MVRGVSEYRCDCCVYMRARACEEYVKVTSMCVSLVAALNQGCGLLLEFYCTHTMLFEEVSGE